jgi:hypothetical protein
VGSGTITLACPVDVLSPRQVALNVLDDFPNTLRHAGVGVVSDKNESQFLFQYTLAFVVQVLGSSGDGKEAKYKVARQRGAAQR